MGLSQHIPINQIGRPVPGWRSPARRCYPAADHPHAIPMPPGWQTGLFRADFYCWECVGMALFCQQKSTHGNCRKCLCCNECGKQDLNLHGLAATRPSKEPECWFVPLLQGHFTDIVMQ